MAQKVKEAHAYLGYTMVAERKQRRRPLVITESLAEAAPRENKMSLSKRPSMTCHFPKTSSIESSIPSQKNQATQGTQISEMPSIPNVATATHLSAMEVSPTRHSRAS